MNGSAVDRLRRLRRAMTALFVGVNAVGLVIFAWLLIQDDSTQRLDQADGALTMVTSSISRQVGYDGTVDFHLVNTDELNSQCPQFAILPGSAPAFQAHVSAKSCVPMDQATLSELATAAVQGGTVLTGDALDEDQTPVRFRVEPLRKPGGGYLGAVVAVQGLGADEAKHDEFMWLVIGGGIGLLALLALAGHLVSGRSIRPALNALQQQETLLAETAHDLRSPIAALRALAETALSNPERSADILPRTVGLAATMGGIIDSLLVRARLAAGVEQLNLQPVWLDQLVAGVVEEAEPQGAQVTLTAAPTKVNADPALLRRAIRNLLDNAVRYGHRPDERAIVHITVAGGTVTVADHGPGVDPASVGDAFDRFKTTGGTGLGLSIVRWVTQAHGGVLSVYNADEGGAIFELRLPLIAR